MSILLDKFKRRIKRALTPATPDFDRTAKLALRLRCDLQYVMDIDPSSPWHAPGFVETFGGFNPPTESRSLLQLHRGDRVRSDTLILLLREIIVRNVPGSIAELGVHRGNSARLLHHYCPERRLYLFDTFTGFAARDLESETLDTGFNRRAEFADTELATVKKIIQANNDHVVFVPGWFPETITPAITAESFAFVHLDADLEAPTSAALEFFWPRLSSGGYIVAHDYNAWPGVRLAVDRFRASEPVTAVPLADKSGSIVLAKA